MINGITDSNQKIVSDGLILNLDAGQLRSYPGSGSTWTDLSGNGYNTTLTNSPTYNSSNGGSIVFNGTNQYAQTASISNYKSICGWIYISTSFANDQYVIDARTGSPSGYIYSGGTGPDWNQLYINGVATTILPSGPGALANYPIGQWFHFYYRNTALRTGTIKLFCRFSFTEFKAGRLASFYAYNRDLSATEIVQNFNAQKSRFGL